MEWTHVLGIVLGNVSFVIPLFLWNRSESREDIRHTMVIIETIHKEVKDFHERLCEIEERNKKNK